MNFFFLNMKVYVDRMTSSNSAMTVWMLANEGQHDALVFCSFLFFFLFFFLFTSHLLSAGETSAQPLLLREKKRERGGSLAGLLLLPDFCMNSICKMAAEAITLMSHCVNLLRGGVVADLKSDSLEEIL